ncbi:MAG TPA: hypothetical protein VNG33_22780 [Polyangiaceae bacterium]|nr:hypothetical protein [Polyangiaceae bacterium]
MTRGLGFALLLLVLAGAAQAQTPTLSASAAPSPSAAPAAAAPAPAASSSVPATALPAEGEAGCSEKLPSGKARPELGEAFPTRGLSGHALPLVVTLSHGAAETVLPTGFRFQADAPEAKALKTAGFIVPNPDGGAGPKVERTEGAITKSRVTLSFVALPKEPGRHELTLPPMPITVARASGELIILCTKPHRIVIEDPTSSTPNAKPKANPPPRQQREEWTLLKQAVGIGAIALVVGAAAAWLIGRWLKRPRALPPPPPPRPPWEVALESLHDLRHAGLTREGRFAEHFDRVSDIVRRYLGDRYGFDGLESTTREMLGELRGTTPRITVLDDIERFLRQADLVKFARLTPSEPECSTALGDAEQIIERTVPPPMPVGAPVAPLPDQSPSEEEQDG